MKTSTIILLIIVMASVGATVAAVVDAFSPFIPTTTIVKSYVIQGQVIAYGGMSSYQFETPVAIQSGAVLSGNLTSYCVQQPASLSSGGRSPPQLYVLTLTEEQLWSPNSGTGPPKSFVASISYENAFANYTFNGPAQTEGLVFHVPIKTPDYYYFIAYLQQSSCGYGQSSHSPSVFLDVVTVGPNPTVSLVIKAVGMISSVILAVVTIRDHRKD
jgi:hypothetical protein